MATGFTHRVAIQQAEIARTSTGEVVFASFEDIDGLGDIPAIVVPTVDEKRQERYSEDKEMWQIVLAGDWPQIKQNHFVLSEGTRYEVQRVSTTKRGRVTTLLARLGTMEAAPEAPAAP